MSAKQQHSAKASSKNLTESKASSNAEKLTPRQWNLVSQRLIDFSTQISKSKGEVSRLHAVKSAKA